MSGNCHGHGGGLSYDGRSDTVLHEFFKYAPIELDTFSVGRVSLTWLPNPSGEVDDATPRHRESVRVCAIGFEESDVLLPAVVVVSGELAAGTISDSRLTLRGCALAELVPDGWGATTFIDRAFNLVRSYRKAGEYVPSYVI